MFKKLRKYVKNVDCGLIEQKVNVIVESNEDLKLSPDNNYYEQYGKLMEIKDYIETHVHGITVKVSGGEKVLSDDLGYDRRPIVVRTVKNDEPSFYNEVAVNGLLMDERDCAMRVYDDYIGTFLKGGKSVKTGTISRWEQFIAKWLDDADFYDSGYYCEDNQLFRIKEDNCESIISNVAVEVTGLAEVNKDSDDIDTLSLVIICKDKQILLGYEGYYIYNIENDNKFE
ncbi:hypothetical protein [Lacrimispora sp.]|uniref:hypothetical protein n=1 Tax=Lacrimispora sp. TaxID=2719234 RepID=UPI0028A5F30F|nr:hypothetical protein [Lacrimispora sp.]